MANKDNPCWPFPYTPQAKQSKETTHVQIRQKFGSWYCYDTHDTKEEQPLYMADTLAFAFMNGDIQVLQKHGPLERVEQWAKKERQKLAEAGEIGQEMANNIIVISSKEWDLETIHKFIDITGYIGVWYNKQLATNTTPQTTTQEHQQT